jgi:hypothetical protein
MSTGLCQVESVEPVTTQAHLTLLIALQLVTMWLFPAVAIST